MVLFRMSALVLGALLAMAPQTSALASPISPPTNLTAESQNASQIRLRWDGPHGARSFRVLRSTTSGGPYVLAAAIPWALDYLDGGLAPATTYFYVVQAVGDRKVSGNSNQASATTTFLCPTQVKTQMTRSTVDVTWVGVPGAVRYEILRNEPIYGERLMGTTTGTSFHDATVADDTNYSYAIRAVAPNGVTGTSDWAWGQTGPPTTTVLTVSPVRSELGQSVLLSASVRDENGEPVHGGDVWFMYENYRIDVPVPVGMGRAEMVVTMGSAPITVFARYTGGSISSLGGSASNSVSHIIDPQYATAAFQLPQLFPVGGRPYGVTAGDLTGDGLGDIVLTTGQEDHAVYLFAQQGDHSLASPQRFPTVDPTMGSMTPVVGDIEGDGRNELIVGSGDGVDIFRQPDFSAPAHLSFGAGTVESGGVWDVHLADLDGDGHRDLITMSGLGVLVAYQIQNGQFAAPSLITSLWGVLGIADVAGDARPDLVLLNGPGYTVEVLAQAGPRTFAPPVTFTIPTGYWPKASGLATGDLTGDGRADVVVTVGGNTPGSRVQVLRHDAAGTLGTWEVYPVYDGVDHVTVVDVNADARLDVLETRFGWGYLGVMLQRPDGRLGQELLYRPYSGTNGYGLRGFGAWDVNGDGRRDLLLADPDFGLVVRYQTTPPAPTAANSTPEKVNPAPRSRQPSADRM